MPLFTVPVWTAFGAGLLSLLSPCVLALLPAYVSYLGGLGGQAAVRASPGGRTSRAGLLRHALLFVLGFSAVFVAFGASASALGQWLLRYEVFLQKAAGLLVGLFGLHVLGVLRLPFLERGRQWQVSPRVRSAGGWGALAVGMAFAAGWSPCVGPILGSILMLAAASETLGQGVLLLTAYSAGMAIPFLAFALFLDRARGVFEFFRRYHRAVMSFSGAMLIVIGVMLYTDLFTRLAAYANYYYLLIERF